MVRCSCCGTTFSFLLHTRLCFLMFLFHFYTSFVDGALVHSLLLHTPILKFIQWTSVTFCISTFNSTPLPLSHIQINKPTSCWSHDALWVFSSCCLTVLKPAGFDLKFIIFFFFISAVYYVLVFTVFQHIYCTLGILNAHKYTLNRIQMHNLHAVSPV